MDQLILISLILCSALSRVGTNQVCDSYGCYINMGTTKKFDKARTICEMSNMTLLPVKNHEMSKSVLSHFPSDFTWLDYKSTVYPKPKWLDGRNVEWEGLGTLFQPNEQCVHIAEDQLEEIREYITPCTQKLMFICSNEKGCENSHRCHGLSTTKATWFAARNACRREGGDLYVPGSSDARTLNLTYTTKHWIGARRVAWFSADRKEAKYTNWAEDQPKDPAGNACVVMDKNGEWCTTHCYSFYANYTVICYKENDILAANPTPHNGYQLFNLNADQAHLLIGIISGLVLLTIVISTVVVWKLRQKNNKRHADPQNYENRPTTDIALYDMPEPTDETKTAAETTYDSIDGCDILPPTNETDLYDNPVYAQGGANVCSMPITNNKDSIDDSAPRKPPRILADSPDFEICENEIYNMDTEVTTNDSAPRKPPRIFADSPDFEICENDIYNMDT